MSKGYNRYAAMRIVSQEMSHMRMQITKISYVDMPIVRRANDFEKNCPKGSLISLATFDV
ncbi:hypothetical protein AB9X29_003773 [Vibrio vulnificus]